MSISRRRAPWSTRSKWRRSPCGSTSLRACRRSGGGPRRARPVGRRRWRGCQIVGALCEGLPSAALLGSGSCLGGHDTLGERITAVMTRVELAPSTIVGTFPDMSPSVRPTPRAFVYAEPRRHALSRACGLCFITPQSEKPAWGLVGHANSVWAVLDLAFALHVLFRVVLTLRLDEDWNAMVERHFEARLLRSFVASRWPAPRHEALPALIRLASSPARTPMRAMIFCTKLLKAASDQVPVSSYRHLAP